MPRPGRLRATLVTALLSITVLSACSSRTDRGRRPTASSAKVPTTAAATTASTATTTAPRTTTAGGPTSPAHGTAPTGDTPPTPATTPGQPAPGTVADVSAAQVSSTWRPGCPVGPAQLRMLTMGYWGFDGQPHTGTMVVNAAVTTAVLRVFATLYAEHFPIRQMEPEDAYGGKDPVSMAADNTSGFNCRDAVAPGPPTWSVHAYGEAIDVNPVENPYLEGGQVQPAQGAPYLNRSDVRPGMAVAGGQLVAAFASVGWLWGGRWSASRDYQHFSATGG